MIRVVQTDLYAVIGHPVAHSLSPVMMNAAFANLGLAAHYLAFDVDDFEAALRLLGDIGVRGLSVTIPHKEAAFRLATKLDDAARAMGAVNTLKRLDETSGWQGLNTDWLGAVRAIEQVTTLPGKRVLVIGAGGSARAVIYGLQRQGAVVTVTNRTPERGLVLAATFQCDFLELQDAARHTFDILVQCTSVGLAGTPAAELLPASSFRPGMTVLDLVYRPQWTPFLLAARAAGGVTVSGLDMLLFQGVAQFEWWLDRPAPLTPMKDALLRALSRENHDSTH